MPCQEWNEKAICRCGCQAGKLKRRFMPDLEASKQRSTKAFSMKSKDLQVGMCVAIKEGYGVRKAYVLEIGTAWKWDYQGIRLSRPDPKYVAVAVVSHSTQIRPDIEQEYRPDIATLTNVLDTWEGHVAQQEADRKTRQAEREKDDRRQEDYQRRFARIVGGLSEEPGLVRMDSLGYVTIRLDVLERLLATSASPR